MKTIICNRNNVIQTLSIRKLEVLDKINHLSIYCPELKSYALNSEDYDIVIKAAGNLQNILKVLDRAKVVNEKYFKLFTEDKGVEELLFSQ